MKIYRSKSDEVETIIIKNICDQNTFYSAIRKIESIFGISMNEEEVNYGLVGLESADVTHIHINSTEAVTFHAPHDIDEEGCLVEHTDVIDLEGEKYV